MFWVFGEKREKQLGYVNVENWKSTMKWIYLDGDILTEKKSMEMTEKNTFC